LKGSLRSPAPRQHEASASYTVPTKLKDEVVLERPGGKKPSCMEVPEEPGDNQFSS
jgi:hypothetical protein